MGIENVIDSLDPGMISGTHPYQKCKKTRLWIARLGALPFLRLGGCHQCVCYSYSRVTVKINFDEESSEEEMMGIMDV